MNDITTSDRNAFHQNTGYVEEKHKSDSATTVNIAKVFLYMFIGLAITTIVSFGVGAGVYYGILNNMEDGTIPTIYFASLIFSAVALFVDMIIINFVVVRGKHSILVPGIIYAVLVGVLFSMLTIVIDWRIIGMAFGITAFIL